MQAAPATHPGEVGHLLCLRLEERAIDERSALVKCLKMWRERVDQFPPLNRAQQSPTKLVCKTVLGYMPDERFREGRLFLVLFSEIFQQDAVTEDVAAADFAKQSRFRAVVEEPVVAPARDGAFLCENIA